MKTSVPQGWIWSDRFLHEQKWLSTESESLKSHTRLNAVCRGKLSPRAGLNQSICQFVGFRGSSQRQGDTSCDRCKSRWGQSFPAGNRSLAWKRPRNKQAHLRSTFTLFQGRPEISSVRVSTGFRGLGIHWVIRRGVPTHVQGTVELIFYLKGKWILPVISGLFPTQGTKVYSTLHSSRAALLPLVTHHLASVCLSFLHPGHTNPPSSTLIGHWMLSL